MVRRFFTAMFVLGLVVFVGVVSAPVASGDPSPLWGTSPGSDSAIWPGETVTVSGGDCVVPGADTRVSLRYYMGLYGLEQDFEVSVDADGTWAHSLVVPPEWVTPAGYVLVDAQCDFYDSASGTWGRTEIYAAPQVRYWFVAEPPAVPQISVDAQGGSSVTVNGTNFPANDEVTISIESVRTTLGIVTTTASGTFGATYPVPCTVGNGPHTIIATIVSTGVETSAPVMVSGCGSGVEVAGASVTAMRAQAVAAQPHQAG